MSTVNVATAEELMTAYNNGSTNVEDKTIKVIGDIDFNSGQYSDWENNFFVSPAASSGGIYTTTLDGSWEDSQGNTKNRTISNIFLYSGKVLFYNSGAGNKLICKNLTFEVVGNGANICDAYQKCSFENCVFNVRLYSNKYNQFYGKPPSRTSEFLLFKNCVFNFYIASNKYDNTALFAIEINDSGSTIYPIIIKSCIFKIRNASNKFITLVSGTGGGYRVPCKIYNSAIFYNDVGAVQPPYSITKDSSGNMPNCNHIVNPTSVIADRIMNIYIASFDYYPLPAGFVKPIIVAFNYDLADTGYMDYVINNNVRDMVYGDFTDIDPNYLHGYPSFGVDVIDMEYTILSSRDMVYGDFTDMNSDYLHGYPSFSVDVIGPDYAIPNMCREYVYGSFTDMNSAYLHKYPSFSVDVIDMDYTITDECREYVYGNFTKIDSNISEIKYPIFDNSLEYYETFGAIYDTEVNKLVIPKTVTFIADYAFYRSNNIKKVKISSECLYYEHSFPEDCKIEFYEEEDE